VLGTSRAPEARVGKFLNEKNKKKKKPGRTTERVGEKNPGGKWGEPERGERKTTDKRGSLG